MSSNTSASLPVGWSLQPTEGVWVSQHGSLVHSQAYVLQHFIHLDDVWIRRQSSQRLDFPEAVHLFNAVKVVLHALDRQTLPILDGLCL